MRQPNSLRRSIIVYGDIQAEAVALVLKNVSGICDRFEVQYLSSQAGADLLAESLSRCAVFFEQDTARSRHPGELPKTCKHVRFPLLDFNLLWPFNCVNPYNRPEPPRFPFGRFPNGNSFVISCVERGLSADEILELDLSDKWHASWPDLDELFMSESVRLSMKDSKCTVTLGSYILKHFRKEKLFTAIQSPTDKLLSELISRVLYASFGSGSNIDYSDVGMTLKHLGPRDLLGAFSVPIHPRIAEHFDLIWYSPSDTYNIFDVQALRYEQYVKQMVESTRKNGARRA